MELVLDYITDSMIKLIFIMVVTFMYYIDTNAEDKIPSIKQICNVVQYKIRNLELQKQKLNIEFKKIESEIKQFELLPELTNDVNKTIKQQIKQAKLYHYLECSRFDK